MLLSRIDIYKSRYALFNWENAKEAQKHARDKGYYQCLLKENTGSATAPVVTHVAGHVATKITENNTFNSVGAAAGMYYHFTDKRFTAWVRTSKVLVPGAVAKVKVWAKRANVVGWAYFDYELARSISNCSDKL
jgi:hypothetical protein